jgi:5-methylthioadenosine/S-adenosylhomocysteine deaminase
MEEAGFLKPEVLAIHCVDLDDQDIELLARHDVKVSYNPISNMYLGSGVAPVTKMQKAGITISLGVDGAGSNNSQDMLETLKIAALLQKVDARDASIVDAQQVLDWATRGGARAIGLEKEIGSLEVGKRADLFVVAPNTAKIVPIHDPIATLVYSCGEENVVMTIANGKILMRDRVIQHYDEQEIIQNCQQAALALAERCGSNSRIKRSWNGNINGRAFRA